MARQRSAARVEEELGAAAAAQQLPSPVAQVASQSSGCRTTHGHHALLVALAGAAQQPTLHVDVPLAQPDELASPQAAAVQELESGKVTLPQRADGHDGGKQPLDLLHREHAR